MLPIFVATSNALLTEQLKGRVWGIKRGAIAFGYDVPDLKPLKYFLDLKLHDTPAGTMETLSWMDSDVDYVTMHLGDNAAALREVTQTKRRYRIIGVTILTTDLASLDSHDLYKRIEIAELYGIDHITCPPRFIETIRRDFPKMGLVVPGIRMPWDRKDEHAYVCTPRMALDKGADYLVIGRPITRAPDPMHIIELIEESLHA